MPTHRFPARRAALLAAWLLASSASAATQAPAAADSILAFPAPADRRWQVGFARADRLQHGSLSAVLAGVLRLSGRSRGESFAWTLALGALKELRDSRHGRFDAIDLGADAAGAALGSRLTTTTR